MTEKVTPQMRMFAIIAAFLIAVVPELSLTDKPIARAQGAHSPTGAPPAEATTPEQKMLRRFPQPVRVGALIGSRVLDFDDVTLGRVRQVVRTPDGKIALIMDSGGWLGWGARQVALPIETVALIGANVAALDMSRDEIAKAPTWSSTGMQPIGPEEMIKVAITRR